MNKILNQIEQFKYQTPQNQIIQGGVGLSLLIFFSYKMLPNFQKRKTMKYFQQKAQKQRLKRDNYVQNLKIPYHGLNKDLQNSLLKASIPEMKKMLESKIITSVQLLNFFAERTFRIGLKLNLITESNYEAALEEAQKCDKLRNSNPEKCTGELFGIVMSLKDSLIQKGFPSTLGLASNLDNIEYQDGLTVKLLKDAGAIIFVRTNVPQMLLTLETDNFIYGQAQNPWNTKKSTGGSSGGSAGLVASRCSPLCFGGDLGGSIRVPCLFNGITGFKPCSYRVSSKGQTNLCHLYSGQISIRASLGPIGKYVDDNVEVMKAYLNQNSHKNLTVSQKDLFYTLRPWNNEEYISQKKFKIGYYKSVELFPATQPVQEAVTQAVQILRQQGHQLIEIVPPNIEELADIFFNIIGCTGDKMIIEALKGERHHTLYNDFISMLGFSQITRTIIGNILGFFGQKRLKKSLFNIGEKDALFLMQKSADIKILQQKWVEFFENLELDAIVCPGFGIVAGQHSYSTTLALPFIYSGFLNVIDFTAGVVPITIVKDDLTVYKDKYNDLITKFAKKSQKDTKGLPVGVQIVTLPFKDELCLNIMKQIEDKAKFHENYYPKI